jgi:hypothetical protein
VRSTPLRIAVRPAHAAKVTVTVRSAGAVVKRWTKRAGSAGVTRLRLAAGRMKAGDVRIDLSATAGAARQAVRLTARRLPG